MQMMGVPAIVQVFSSVRFGSRATHVCPACSIRVRPSPVISECVIKPVQNQLAISTVAIQAETIPTITHGEIVNQRRIVSLRLSNSLLLSLRKNLVSVSIVCSALVAMLLKSLLKLSS
jgi:hypothetical protein